MHRPLNHVQDSRLKLVIDRLFGNTQEELFDEIKLKFQFTDLSAGSILMKQGDEGDSVYLVLGGRLRVFVTDETGRQNTVGTIFQGETVGEMSLLTGEPRSASVKAVRDSSLAKLERSDFEEIIARHPDLVMNITRMVIQRLNRMNTNRKVSANHITMAIMPAGLGSDVFQFGNDLKEELEVTKKVVLINFEMAAGQTGIRIDQSATDINQMEQQMLSSWLDEKENEYDIVLLPDEKEFPFWTSLCAKRADVLLLVAQSERDTELSRMEHEIYDSPHEDFTSTRYLIVVHPNQIIQGRAREWLTKRKVTKHFHIRKEQPSDLSRLCRFLAGTSTGLVLSGGGARGIAHLGVYKALQEYGIEIDLVGGTSIGAIISGFIGQGLHTDEIILLTREMFLANPTPLSEFSFIPFYGLLRGKRLESMLQQCFGHLDIEDLPLNYFCVSSNLTISELHIHQAGKLNTAIRASISLPGILPPVILNNNVFVDGGIFNNIPIDVMSLQGAGKIIAVSLSKVTKEDLSFDQLPNKYNILFRRFFRKSPSHVNLPTLMDTLVKSTTINSDSREKEAVQAADLLFNPDVSKFGLTNWAQFDKLISEGYNHAIKVLNNLPEKHQFK